MALARNKDPVSSHTAITDIEVDQQRIQALQAVKKFPWRTSKELAELTGLDRYMLARRLPEIDCLVQGNDRKIRRCSVSGKLSVIWELK